MHPLRLGKVLILLIAVALVLWLSWRAGQDEAAEAAVQPVVLLQGPSMGTQYRITVVAGDATRQAAWQASLQSGVQTTLDAVQNRMTTYDDASELMQLNHAPVDADWLVSEPLLQVLLISQRVHALTDGAFDPSVGEAVNLWGFGPQTVNDAPDAGVVQAARERIGFAALQIDAEKRQVRKTAPITLDLSAVAKGYAVDRVADYLDGQGIEHYFIEVGGEVRVRGSSPRGDAWRVGIEQPEGLPGELYRQLPLAAGSLATSGDYRNYRRDGDQRRSHIIDPTTGEPVHNRIASLSVLHADCAEADALATGLMAMGEDRARALAESEGLAVFMILHDGEGFDSWASPAFQSQAASAGAR